MMKDLWFHVGMPKAGSTAIQNFLSCSLEGFEQQCISFDDVSKLVRNIDEMKEIFKGLPANGLSTNRYSPVVIQTRTSTLVSSENFSYFDAGHLEGLNASGIAVIREPGAWVTSMATQDLLFGIPHNLQDNDELFALGLASQEDQLIELIRRYSIKYSEILANISSWSKVLPGFRLIPHTTNGRMFAEISDELTELGVVLGKSAKDVQLRVSHDFKLAQIGFSLYLAARFLLGCSRTQSCRLTQLALSLDELIYKDHFSDVSTFASEQINRHLKFAHEGYEVLMRLNGRHDDVVPLRVPKLQVLEDDYSRSLVVSLISSKLGWAQVPYGFDAELYLGLNPEIDAGVEIEDRQELAETHYRRYGYLEARPVPLRRII